MPVLASRRVAGSDLTLTTRSRYAAAALVAAGVAAAIILANSHGDVYRMTEGDGQIYQYVAAHFDTPPAEVHPVVRERGTSLRYGRMGLPSLIWLASAGQPEAMPYVQPIIMVFAAGAAGAAIAALLPRAPPAVAILPFLAPGFAVAVSGGFAEVVAVAFALWAVVFAREERWGPATALLAAAMLTRENAGAVLVGVAVWCLLRKNRRPVVVLAGSLVPVLVWYAVVAARYGHIPILDPYLRVTTDTIGPPVVAIIRAIVDSPASSALTAAIHLALAIVAFAMWRRSLFGAVAAAAGLQVLAAGRFSFRFEGEAVRQFTFLQLFLIMAFLWERFAGRQPVGDSA
jgi:hypothetical protein